MTAPGVEGVLAEVLAGHWDVDGTSDAFVCICGHPLDGLGDLDEQHRAHVAAEQAKALAESGLIPTVEIAHRLGQASTCKVWRAGVLVFDGLDRSAAIFGSPS